jgi:hypothetical protein
LDEETEEDRSTRKMDHGKINKRKNLPIDTLENLMGRKERQAGEAIKMQVKLT